LLWIYKYKKAKTWYHDSIAVVHIVHIISHSQVIDECHAYACLVDLVRTPSVSAVHPPSPGGLCPVVRSRTGCASLTDNQTTHLETGSLCQAPTQLHHSTADLVANACTSQNRSNSYPMRLHTRLAAVVSSCGCTCGGCACRSMGVTCAGAGVVRSVRMRGCLGRPRGGCVASNGIS